MLQMEKQEEDAAVKFLIREMYEIGRRAEVNLIEAELYRQIDGRIFFPSGTCAVNAYNTPDWTRTLEGHGFACSEKGECFELDLLQFQVDSYQQVRIRKHKSNDESDKELYYSLWSSSDDCRYNVSNNGLWRSNVFGWPRAWYSDFADILNNDDYILFASIDGKPLGFLHWWPNLYPILLSQGRKGVFGVKNAMREALEKIEEGKIFRVIVSRKAKQNRELIEQALITYALGLMQKDFGFKRCQIGNLPTTHAGTWSFMKKIGGEKVHEIWLMRSVMAR